MDIKSIDIAISHVYNMHIDRRSVIDLGEEDFVKETGL